jgi:hypothetical protein
VAVLGNKAASIKGVTRHSRGAILEAVPKKRRQATGQEMKNGVETMLERRSADGERARVTMKGVPFSRRDAEHVVGVYFVKLGPAVRVQVIVEGFLNDPQFKRLEIVAVMAILKDLNGFVVAIRPRDISPGFFVRVLCAEHVVPLSFVCSLTRQGGQTKERNASTQCERKPVTSPMRYYGKDKKREREGVPFSLDCLLRDAIWICDRESDIFPISGER